MYESPRRFIRLGKGLTLSHQDRLGQTRVDVSDFKKVVKEGRAEVKGQQSSGPLEVGQIK